MSNIVEEQWSESAELKSKKKSMRNMTVIAISKVASNSMLGDVLTKNGRAGWWTETELQGTYLSGDKRKRKSRRFFLV